MALKNHLVFWSIVVGVFVVDRISKVLVLGYIPLSTGIDVFPFLSFTHVFNTGTLFGLFKNINLFFVAFSCVVSAIIIYVYRRYRISSQMLLALILGGALGNLVDRLFYGAVIDFIDFHFWPVFNVADCAISVAVVVLIIREVLAQKYRKL